MIHLKTPTCSAFAANLKTFSLSTSIISWKTDQQGGKWRGCCCRELSKSKHIIFCVVLHWPLLGLKMNPCAFSLFFLLSQTVSFIFQPAEWENCALQAVSTELRCYKGPETVNHHWKSSVKKTKTTSRIMFHHFKPQKEQGKNTYIVYSWFCIQEEQLNRYDVLQLRDVFYIKSFRDKSRQSFKGQTELAPVIFFLVLCSVSSRGGSQDITICFITQPFTESYAPLNSSPPCWTACVLHED